MNTVQRSGLAALVAVTGLIAFPAVTQAVIEPEILAHPDPIIAERYRNGEATIEALRAIALDVQRPSGDRVGALQRLADEFFDAALTPSAELVTDPDTPVALVAARLLADATVMSDHGPVHEQATDIPPFLRLMYWKHETGREGLRRALNDARPEVRDIAASSLASLSDPAALQQIVEGVEANTYSDAEAVNYLGLADPELGAPLMQQLLVNGTPQAQASAVTYLGSNPEYQPMVREDYLFNADAPIEVRSAAAASLGQYDASFPTYATTLTADPTLPAVLYAKVLEGYIDQTGDNLQADEASALKQAVENYTKLRPDTDFSGVLERLNSVRQ